MRLVLFSALILDVTYLAVYYCVRSWLSIAVYHGVKHLYIHTNGESISNVENEMPIIL